MKIFGIIVVTPDVFYYKAAILRKRKVVKYNEAQGLLLMKSEITR